MNEIRHLDIAPTPSATPFDEVRGAEMIEDFLSKLPMSCGSGDELFSTVVRAIGYAASDRTLRAICRRLQKELERR